MKQEENKWQLLLKEAEASDRQWHKRADNVDKCYADLEHIAGAVSDADAQDPEFQIFWANIEVLKPTVYSRPPVPVVTQRFKKRAAVPRHAAEILERALITDVEMDDLHESLKMVRDDMLLPGRGIGRVFFEDSPEMGEQVTFAHYDRKDFRFGPARKWRDVPWVAFAEYLTKKQIKKRWPDAELDGIEFKDHKIGRGDEASESDPDNKAKIWEIWHRSERKICWIAEGADREFEVTDPTLDVKGFFPCPRPAMATVHRGRLTPVPDMAYYVDQLNEINDLTARIAALTEALIVSGVYPSGSKVGASLEVILNDNDKRVKLVPVETAAPFMTGSGGKLVEWIPLQEVAITIRECIAVRRQMMEDVREITGISDIMRGDTDPGETLGAQELKSQYGSVRVQERQGEMIRFALDVIRLKGEIMAEHMAPETLLRMSQVDDLPSEADLAQQGLQMEAQGVPPQQIMAELSKIPTVEKVMQMLRSEKLRPFALEIETNSTIQPDEQRDKANRVEFLEAFGGILERSVPLVQQVPQSAGLIAEALKFTASGFRTGRDMETAIDEFADMVKSMAQGAQQPDPQAEERARQDDTKSREVALKEKKLPHEIAKLNAETQAIQADTGQAERNTQSTERLALLKAVGGMNGEGQR